MTDAIRRRTLWITGFYTAVMLGVFYAAARDTRDPEFGSNFFAPWILVWTVGAIVVLVIGFIFGQRAHGRQKKQFLPVVEQLATRYGLAGEQREILVQVTHQLADIYPGDGDYGRVFRVMDTLTTSGILTGIVADLHSLLKREFKSGA